MQFGDKECLNGYHKLKHSQSNRILVDQPGSTKEEGHLGLSVNSRRPTCRLGESWTVVGVMVERPELTQGCLVTYVGT